MSLDFTPIVLSEGRISLNISTAVSEIGQVSVGINPGIDTRNMRTTIELPSGGSMMLAGLIKSVDRHQVEGTPGLKNLPVLGALFRIAAFQNDQSELAIIVTPYIVNATAEKNLATPDKRLNVATDRQSVLWGRLNKVYGTGRRRGSVSRQCRLHHRIVSDSQMNGKFSKLLSVCTRGPAAVAVRNRPAPAATPRTSRSMTRIRRATTSATPSRSKSGR